MQTSDVIKRGGQRPTEPFDQAKLHASVLAACLSVRTPEGEAMQIADKVCSVVMQWCEAKPEITSNDLRRKASETLDIHHPEASYLYKHHRLVI
jgi:transcriptional regulator NrdR family protein